MVTPDVQPDSAARRPALHRGLRVLGTLLIVLSAITPASSVFIIAPGAIGQAGTGAFWSYVAAGVVGVFMAFVYAELSSAYPVAGGEYTIVGRVLGKLPGVMILGLLLVTQLLILAVIALGVGTYLGVLIDGLNAPLIAAVSVAVATVIAVLDIKLNAVVTGIFLAMEMAALLVLTGLGFLNVERPISDLVLHPEVGTDLAPASIGLIAAATAIAIFSYNGYGSAVYLGEETRDAPRAIARTILWALVITVAAELIPVTAVLLGAPDLGKMFAADNMMQYFVTEQGGDTLNTVISLGIAIAIFNAVIAIMLVSARLMFSSGRDGTWTPLINRRFAAIHPRFGTPLIATVVTGVLSAAACFIPEKSLLVITGTSLVVVYAALCLAVMIGRYNGTTSHAAYRMPLFPVAPVLALAALGYVIYQNARDSEIGRPSLGVTALVVAVGAAYYFLVLRRRGGWTLRGPADDPATADPRTADPGAK